MSDSTHTSAPDRAARPDDLPAKEPQFATLTFWQRLKLLTGRPRRMFDNLFRQGHVRRYHARRRGQCDRCGACCQLGSRCPSLFFDENGQAGCTKYAGWRWPNCRNFPQSPRDIRERDVVSPDRPCGYTFVDE